MPKPQDSFEPTAHELESPAAATLRRVADMQRQHQHLTEKVDDLCIGLQGDRKGQVRGLFERVGDIERWIASRKWAERSIFGVLITLIVVGAVAVGRFVIEEKAKAHEAPVKVEAQP